MRNEVLSFLRSLPKSKEEQFNKAFSFLKKTQVGFHTLRVYNLSGITDQSLKNLLYDLKKAYNIKETEVLSKKAIKLPKFDTAEVTKNAGITPEEIKQLGEVSNDLGKKSDEDKEQEQKKGLHDLYPFLTEKDCPEELHVVTGLLVASWKRYNALHEKVKQIEKGEIEVTEEEKTEAIAACNQEFENNKSLYLELDHYKEKKEVLAAHESLFTLRLKKEVEAMSVEELHKFKDATPPYISRNKTALNKKGLTDEKRVKIEERIKEREAKLALVNKKLGL